MRWMLACCLGLLSGCPLVVSDVARGYNDRCAALLAAGQLDDAETACLRALEHQPRYWDALHNHGLILQVRGDRAGARRRFIEALRANNHMAQSRNQLGALAMEDGDCVEASAQFSEALKLVPEYLEARRNLGVCELRLQRPEAAEKTFRQLLLTHPDNVEGLVGVGLSFAQRKDWRAALQWFQRATERDVGDAGAWKATASALEAMGRRDEAREALERCLLADEGKLECREALRRIGSD
jgi:Flp pilus assembly protein TadD